MKDRESIFLKKNETRGGSKKPIDKTLELKEIK